MKTRRVALSGDATPRRPSIEYPRSFSKLGDLAPGARFQTLRPVRTRIDDRLAAGNDVGNHMSRARANPEAMTAESGREDKAWNRLHFTDCGNAIRCAVDIAGPDIGDCDAPKLGQQFASSFDVSPEFAACRGGD